MESRKRQHEENDGPSSSKYPKPQHRTELGSLYDARVRPIIDLIDRLRHLGTGKYVDLPSITVLGDQSSGKSSVLEAISGIQLPRGTGRVTRCPLKLRMKRNRQLTWMCRIMYQSEEPITIDTPEQVSIAITKAQEELVRIAGDVSSEVITLEVEGKDLPDLTLIDLPGIVRLDNKNEEGSNTAQKVKHLIQEYIKQTNVIILTIIPANIDIWTSGALEMAKEVDPSSIRTLGVITKSDLFNKGEEDHVPKVLLNQKYVLRKGYIAVKCRHQKAINDQQSLEDALDEERNFFENNAHFRNIGPELYGIPSLSYRLTNELVEQAQRVLPDITEKLRSKRSCVKQDLELLGNAMPTENTQKLKIVQMMLQSFDEILGNLVTNRAQEMQYERARNIHNSCRTEYLNFFTGIKSVVKSKDSYQNRAELEKEVETTRGRELFGYVRFETFMKIIVNIVKEFDAPARSCLDNTAAIVKEALIEVCQARFQRFPRLASAIEELVISVMQDRLVGAKRSLDQLFEMEEMVFSQDEHYKTMKDMVERSVEHCASSYLSKVKDLITGTDKDSKKPSENFFTSIKAYLEIVVRRISDYVPMTIMHHMFYKVVSDVQKKVYLLLENESALLESLQEDADIQTERNKLALEMNQIIEALDEIKTFQTS